MASNRTLVFKTPKPLREDNYTLSPQRPKPSPLKRQIFLRDLGLDDDDDDTLADISSPSDTESESEGTQPSEMEFRILQRELDLMSKQRDDLRLTVVDLQKQLQVVKTKLKREETSKKSRTKILQKAHKESLRDKHNLILDLQDLIEEGGDHGHLKLVSHVERLHDEKAHLQNKLITLQENLENKIVDLEDQLQEGASLEFQQGQPTRVPAEMEVLINEHRLLKDKYDSEQRKYVETTEQLEELIKQNKDELTRIKNDHAHCKVSDSRLQEKLHNLRDELQTCKRNSSSKEKELTYMLKKQKEELKLLSEEKERIRMAKESAEAQMVSRLSNQETNSNQAVSRLSEDNKQLTTKIENLQRELVGLRSQLERMQDMESESINVKFRNEELLAIVQALENNLAKQKVDAKEKLRIVEVELLEARSLTQKQRVKAQESYDDLKDVMQRNERQMKNDLEYADQVYKELKQEADKAYKRLDENLKNSAAQIEEIKEEKGQLKSQLDTHKTMIEKVSVELKKKEQLLISTSEQLIEGKAKLSEQMAKVEQLNENLDSCRIEIKNYENQISLLTGKSTSALAEKERESGDLRIHLNTAQHSLQNEKRKTSELSSQVGDLLSQISKLEKTLSCEEERHLSEMKNTKENHKHEVIKLKASTAITTQNLQTKATVLQKAVKFFTQALKQLNHDNAFLKREVDKFPDLIKQSVKQAVKQINEALYEVNENNKDLVRKYRKEMKLRKKYHNQLVELRGNIRVYVRARPRIQEDGPASKIVLAYDGDDNGLVTVNNTQRGRQQTFELDQVFAPESTQEEIYQEVQALVTSCMDGYHVCIFAYGQTGSGKTYTMEGTQSQPGINQRALGDLFSMIEDRSQDWDYTVSLSLVEIYNESLKDLLCPPKDQQKLDIKMNIDGSLFVQGLTHKAVKEQQDVNRLFYTGRTNRATASTDMNEHSSRSHAVLMINVKGVNKTTGSESFGKLNLIDLAGSERISKSGASGDRLKEAQNINKSLSSLGDVIHALRNKQSHVPFRNSKLTYLLQDSLSKESKTLMVVQVSPVDKNISETLCSLTFAQRVRMVELGQAVKKTK